jgi:hypothetical protein
MKFQNIFLLILIGVIVAGSFYFDHKVNSLQNQLAVAQGKTDTLMVEIKIHDTTFVSVADTIINSNDTTIVGDTIIIDHWPTLVDINSQDLFTLMVKVDTRKSEFKYDYKYKPLYLNLRFQDKYDLRKGFVVELIPNVGSVSVNWGSYKPLKKKFGLTLSGGIYLLDNTPGLLCGIAWKKNELGMLFMEGKKGYYFRRILLDF